MKFQFASLIAAACFAVAAGAAAQPAAPAPKTCRAQGFLAQGVAYKSIEQLPDGRVTFRLCAPDAASVLVASSDQADVIPLGFSGPPGLPMTKDALGIWSVTTAKPMGAGTYRVNFLVDGVKTPDPQATRFSEERTGVDSVVEVTGEDGDFQAWNKDIPHGAVSTVEYWSTALGVKRRAHVYTPPGYMNGSRRYPVLYLVHGAGDSDDSWTSVGHANYILDNLIAAGKAKPMIVVMPFGHTPDRPGVDLLNNQDFGDDLFKDVIPYVEHNYRVIADADHRAMAGLSMGGMHTLRYGLPHPETFHYIGIFSIGIGFRAGPGGVGGADQAQVQAYETQNDGALRRGARDFRLVYYAIGKEDFLYQAAQTMRGVLDKYGVKHVYNESPGGHTWINWRSYLNDFAPRLFR